MNFDYKRRREFNTEGTEDRKNQGPVIGKIQYGKQ